MYLYTSTNEVAPVQFLRGQLAEAQRQYREAISRYKEAIELNPAEGAWHEELARCHLLLLNTEAARQELQISFEIGAAPRLVKKHSLNISQHHTGQLLDEFELCV